MLLVGLLGTELRVRAERISRERVYTQLRYVAGDKRALCNVGKFYWSRASAFYVPAGVLRGPINAHTPKTSRRMGEKKWDSGAGDATFSIQFCLHTPLLYIITHTHRCIFNQILVYKQIQNVCLECPIWLPNLFFDGFLFFCNSFFNLQLKNFICWTHCFEMWHFL